MLLFIFLVKFCLSDHENSGSPNIADYVVKIQNPRIEDFKEFVAREQFTAEAFRYYRSDTLFKIKGDREIIVKEETINSILNFESCHVRFSMIIHHYLCQLNKKALVS